ncbi:rhombosortase [Marinimicrobium alkaliphilum]|uniref:rhombosortase n=1 Tax=Marinimicrobium alkaliphilum TaxID=2202654 RepID=UPI000DBA1B90|nr:rhombosortase [Marinimicrobium alkaliphilum]
MTATPILTPSVKLTLLFAAVALLLAALPGWSEPALEYNREAIASGQWWRLLTGHFVHYGLYHLGMNVLALIAIGWVLLKELPVKGFVILWLACSVAVSTGLLWRNPEMLYYAGLSGVLHGLLVAGLVFSLPQTPLFNAAALGIAAVKIGREQLPGFDASHELLPVPVAVDAHLFGALAGLAWGLAWLINKARKRGPYAER